MFFKPLKGVCSCHQLERWILNKKGECNETIRDRKKDKVNRDVIRLPNNKRWPSEDVKTSSVLPYKRRAPIKKQKNPQTFKKRKSLQRYRKPTGEKQIFEEIFEEAAQKSYPDAPKCACCPNRIWQPGPINFSHLLGKGAYPAFRLRKENIWLCCEQCHREWETTDRRAHKFAAKLAEANRLKQLYYAEKRI